MINSFGNDVLSQINVSHRHSDIVFNTSIRYNNNSVCYNSTTLGFDQRKESYIRVNTRKLNRELCIGLFTLYTKLQWYVLLLLLPTLSDYMFVLRSTCIVHIVWYYPSRTFYILLCDLMSLWPLLWSCHLMWLMCDSVIITSL